MNWKQIFVLMLLGSSLKPSADQLRNYVARLTSKGEMIELQDFLSVSF